MAKASAKEDKITKNTGFPDKERFVEKVIGAYRHGAGADDLPSDAEAARALIPPGTAAVRDFSYIAPEFPALNAENCVGCMECVTACPDTAILAKVIGKVRHGETACRDRRRDGPGARAASVR